MPTADGEPITIAHVWSLAVMTSDPYRQEAALALARWLTEPKQMADFARATQLLPARFEAIEFWGLLPEELTFLERFLGGAVPDLPPMVDQPVRRALQAGLRALLKGDVDTPEAAATYALTNLR
jgi:ABC-type glycerol-3-phosphate transport system substrate-binding protein